MAGAEDQDQFARAIAALLIGLAREYGDLVLILDDVQWLDPGSRRVLALLSFDLDTAAVLVVATARDDASSTALTDALMTQLGAVVDLDLALPPLDQAGVRDQIESLMPGLSANTRVVTLLNARSNGSPFIVQEYLMAVVDAGLLQPYWGTWILDEAGLDALDLPNDALGLVITRVTSLGPVVRDLLITAAAIGSRFDPTLLATVRSRDLNTVLADLNEATARGLIEPHENGRYSFLHDKIREALLDELSPTDKAELHARIAQALEVAPLLPGGRSSDDIYALAHHHILADHRPDVDRALAACRAAGRQALEDHAPAEAVTFLQHAATLGDPRDSEFLLLLGTALKQVDRLLEARESLERALEAEAEPLLRAEILILIAETFRSSWEMNLAQEAIRRGLAELGERLPRNPLALVVSSLVRLVGALLMQWTGIRFGSATGERRRRCQAIAGLHDVGAYVTGISRSGPSTLAHTLRGLYRANQLGAGREYAIGQCKFGQFCSFVGFYAAARRAFARAEADPANSSPFVRASTANCRSLSLYFGGSDNGQALSQVIENQGEWLDLGIHLDSLGILNLEACAQGRTAEGEYWLARGLRRFDDHGRSAAAFVCNRALTDASLGRVAQAGTELRRINERFADNTALELTLWKLVSSFVVMGEQEEFGAPFEAAVAEFKALKLRSGHTVRMDRMIHFQIAKGRLTQLRSADSVQRPARLKAARQAVRQMTRAPKIDVLQARGALVRAELLVLEQKPRQALKVLERMPVILVPDAPRLSYEAARIRAAALIDLGGAQEGARYAEWAMSLAQANGWPHLVRAIAAQFGVALPERGSLSLPSVYPTGRTGTGTGTGTERQRLLALQQVSEAASKVLDPGVLARIALDETIRILAADRAFLFLTDGPGDELLPHLGRDAEGNDITELSGYSTSLVQRVRVSGEPLVITGTDEGAALGAQSVVLHGLRSIMAAPLQLDGRLLGVVYLDSQVAKGIFTVDDVGILTALTTHIATSLETIRAAQLEISVQTARHQRDLADLLRQSLQSMSETLDPVEVTQRLFDAIPAVVRCDGAWVLSADGPESECVMLTNDGPGGALARYPIPEDPRILALIAPETPSVGSLESIPLALFEQLIAATSWIALPMRTRSQKAAVLILASTTPGIHLDEEIEVASVVVAQGIAAYDKAILFTQVQELAVLDELTQIANRRRFFEVAVRDVATALRHARPLAALMIDIDHFKRVNDTHGHATGDDVIRTVAQRLNAQIRETDLIGRYGGEEFALLLPGLGPDDDLPERLRACIADTPVETRTGPLEIRVSIGLASLTGDDGDIATLLARADQALYQAKQSGRNRVQIAPTPPVVRHTPDGRPA